MRSVVHSFFLFIFSVNAVIAGEAKNLPGIHVLSITAKKGLVTHILEVTPLLKPGGRYYVQVDRMPKHVRETLSARYVDDKTGKIHIFVPYNKVNKDGDLNDFDLLIVMPSLKTKQKIAFSYKEVSKAKADLVFRLEVSQVLADTDEKEEVFRFGAGVKF